MGTTDRSVLIIGGSGFLGTHLALHLRKEFKVYATYDKNQISIPDVMYFPFHFNDTNLMRQILYLIRPDIVIYALWCEDRVWAEKHTRHMEMVFSTGAAAAISISEVFQPRFIYFSNAYVFDGLKGNFHEDEVRLPRTLVGKMQLNGENLVRLRSIRPIIIRLSPVYGIGNGYHLSWLDRLRMSLERGLRFHAAIDEIHSFVSIESACELVRSIISAGIKNKIYHCGGLTKMTQYEFAVQFANLLNYNSNLIIKSYTNKKILRKQEILDYSLNSSQAVLDLKIQPLLLEEGFNLIQKKLIACS